MGYKTIAPGTVVIKEDIIYRDQKRFLNQAANMFIFAVLGILTWGWMEIDSVLEPPSSGHSKNCSFWYFSIGFIFQPWRLLLGHNKQTKYGWSGKTLLDSRLFIITHEFSFVFIGVRLCYFFHKLYSPISIFRTCELVFICLFLDI